jgi:hypothetical protein
MKHSDKTFYSRHRWKIWVSAVVALLIIFRLILPFILLKVINKELAGLDGYSGHVQDIDLAIYRGAYKIYDFYLNKVDTNTNQQTQFIDFKKADLSVHWAALFHGRIVGELYITKPQILFTLEKVEPKDVQKDSTTLKALLDDLMPLKINRFEITDGRLRYQDPGSKPPVDIALTEINVLAENLSSVIDSNKLLPGMVHADAVLYEGNLNMDMKINPLLDQPAFDLNAELKNTSLPKLNEFFKAYGKVDVSRGTFGLYTEFATKDGKFNGYVKPLITDLKVLGHEDQKDSFLQKLWEGIVGGVGEVLENQPKDQLATRIPIKGEFKDPLIDNWTALIEILRNAFIQALQPTIDNQINIKSVEQPDEKKKGFLHKLFAKKGNKKEA